jgi:hypothetical protein
VTPWGRSRPRSRDGADADCFELAGAAGNPKLQFRTTAPDLWAIDYDTLVVVDPRTWRVTRSAGLQEGGPLPPGLPETIKSRVSARQFVGEFAFDAREELCVIARPFSSDVIAVEPSSLRVTHTAALGAQPLEVAILKDHGVVARDWKSGELLRGELQPLGACPRAASAPR